MAETTRGGSALKVAEILSTDRWLHHLSRSLAAGDFEADDIRQDTWLAALQACPSGDSRPRSWLARVAANVARRGHRQCRRRLRRERRAARSESQQPHTIERVELRQQVIAAVLALREPYRSTVVLRFFEEMSLKEVAAAEGVPLNTVKTRVCRALALLRQRLDGRYGTRASWLVLLPVLVPGLSARSAAAASRSAGWSTLTQGSIASMSTKTVVSSLCLSVALVAGLGVASYRIWTGLGDTAPSDRTARAGRAAAGPENGRRTPPPAGSAVTADPAPIGRRVAPPAHATPTNSAAEDEPSAAVESVPESPASPEALATRQAFASLKKAYGDGGGTGWRSVGTNLAALEQVLLASEEGFAEFLALLDGETDPGFLEALMHHLPLADTESKTQIVDDEDLQQEIWDRFEQAEDPQKRMAFLRFFAFNQKLSAARMDTFLEVAKTDASAKIRELGLDAIASNRELIGETWETLAQAVESDPAPECRETAINGLAGVKTERAAALVTAAFSSPEERLRAAAWLSAAGDDPPDQVTGGDLVAYLVRELRGATTRRYKQALLRRLLERAPQILETEIEQALPREKDMAVRKDYQAALQKIAEARGARRE